MPHVHFIIGGDGNQRHVLQGMVAVHGLEHRVQLLGEVPHCDVQSVRRVALRLWCLATVFQCVVLWLGRCSPGATCF